MNLLEKYNSPIRKKLVLIGDSGCGKTSLLYVFNGSYKKNCMYDDNPYLHFSELERFKPCIFEKSVCPMSVNDTEVDVELCDTVGDEDCDIPQPNPYRNADVIIICYSISNPISFLHVVEKWGPNAQRYCPGVPIVLVANKTDLRDDPETIEKLARETLKPLRCLESREIAAFMRHGVAGYRECSAKCNKGVLEMFQFAMETVVKPKKHGFREKFCHQM